MSIELVGLESLPNVFVKEIIINGISNDQINVKVKLRIHDLKQDSVWFDESQFMTKLLRIGLFFSESPELSRNINIGQINPVSLKPLHTKSIYAVNENEENLIFDFEFDKNFPRGISHLSVYCFSFIDKKQIKGATGITVPENFMGPIKGEKIFENGGTAKTTNIFKRQNGQQWPGPVHSHQGNYMIGSYHSNQPHESLSLLSVRNTKIKDLRTYKSNNFLAYKEKSPVASDLYVSYGVNTDVNAIFMINMKTLLISNTKYGNFLRTTTDEVISQLLSGLTLKMLTIERHRIKVRKQSNFLRSSREKTKKIFMKKPIVKSYDDSGQSFQNITRFERRKRAFDLIEANLRSSEGNTRLSGEIFSDELSDYKKVSKIQEMFFNYGKEIRTFQFNDYELTNRTPGDYKYKLSLSFVDPTRKFLTSLSNSMRENLKQLSRYEQLVTRGVKQIDIDYKSIVVSYVKHFCYIYDKTKNEKQDMVLTNLGLLDPATATLRSIKKFSQAYNDLASEFVKITNFDINIRKFNNDLTSIKSKEPSVSRIEYSKVFEKIVSPMTNQKSFSYMRENTSDSMKILTRVQLQEEGNTQINKHYNQQPSQGSSTLSQEAMARMNNITENSLAYFGPEKLFSTSGILSMVGSDASTYYDKFNEFMENNKLPFGISFKDTSVSTETKEPDEMYVAASEILGENQSFVTYTDVPGDFNVVEEQTQSQVTFGNYFSGFNNSRTFKATIEQTKTLDPETIQELPNQLKAVALGNSNATKGNYVTSTDDLLANPRTSAYYEVSNFSVQKLVYVDRFDRNENNEILLNKPMFKTMTLQNFALLSKPVICFLQAYTNNSFNISDENRLNVVDSVFILSDENLLIPRARGIIEESANYADQEIPYQSMNSHIIEQTGARITVQIDPTVNMRSAGTITMEQISGPTTPSTSGTPSAPTNFNNSNTPRGTGGY